MPNRVRVHPYSRVRVFKYNSSIAAILLMLSIVTKGVEVVLPHPKGGRLMGLMAKFSKKISYIDDGMDTFRDVPKNVEINLLRNGLRYYTFDYLIPVAKWLSVFELIPVCPIKALADDVKPAFDMPGIDCLVIESPGVELTTDFNSLGEICYIKHPSYIKNHSIESDLNFVSGSDFSIEKTILKFNGTLVMGESMVLIFSLLCIPNLTMIHLHLSMRQYQNLTCLHPLLHKCGSIRLYNDCE